MPGFSRVLKNSLLPRLLKKVQMQGGARGEVRGVLGPYVAAPRERANAADGPFSAACQGFAGPASVQAGMVPSLKP
jgi:hypothetical protein